MYIYEYEYLLHVLTRLVISELAATVVRIRNKIVYTDKNNLRTNEHTSEKKIENEKKINGQVIKITFLEKKITNDHTTI